jgi:flagellar L-ring protein precursor FlgH
MRNTAILPMAALLTSISGCTAYQTLPMPDRSPAIVYPTIEPAAYGAISSPNQGLFLFQDAKAYNVGDLLTIELVEKTVAQKSASTSTSKEGSVGISPSILFGHDIAETETTLSGSRTFDGQGDSAQSNKLEGKITVSVLQRLPNGNLVVGGEKQLALNQGSEFVRLEGVVRPVDIGTDNTVTSDRIANARVTYAGRGALADSNAQGWALRFFNSPWMPF